MIRTVVTVAAWIFVCGVVWAQQSEDLRDPRMISAGHMFLEKQCAHCHGEDGKGDINLARRVLEPDGVFQAIAPDGREKNGLRMAAWREVLTDDEIWQARLMFCQSASARSKP